MSQRIAWALAISLATFCSCHRAEEKSAATTTAKSEEKTVEGGLKISAESQAQSGIKTVSLDAAHFAPSTRLYGRVLDPSTLIQGVSDLAVARAAQVASEQELQRNEKLNTLQENVSQHAVETARASADRDKLAVELAEEKITASWGQALSTRNDLTDFAHALAEGKQALVRLDLPAGAALPAHVPSITVHAPDSDTVTWTATVIGRATSADPQTQTQGIVATIEKNPPPIGLVLLGQIENEKPRDGVRVPRSAIVRFGDGTFVFIQKEADLFVRQAVKISGELGDDWFVEDGLQAGQRVVSEGAQQLLSEELKGSSAPED